ncbi:MAG: HD-GYP domain-containing protein [Nitrospirota bacterium]|nr:HD-GYP domain-containing protein [Nitrospirota bacterium]MDH5767821.1 HD-GYP domain-containing protein [Nitrospirota bacterium]
MAIKEEKQVFLVGKDVINQLSIILKTALIHDPANIAVRTAIEKFIMLVNTLIETERTISLELIGEFFYINGVRIRYSLEYLLNFDFLVKEFKKREIGSILFKDIVKPQEIQVFLEAFIASGYSEDPYETMGKKIDALHTIKIDRLKKIGTGEETDVRKVIKKTYFNAVSYVKGVITKVRSGEKVNIRKAKRLVETVVDQLLDKEQVLLSMTAIKNYDDYTYHHSVNVSILSIALGQRLGLNRKALTELGLASLFHDLGKIEIPQDVLNKPTSFNEDEWKLIRKHPIWGVFAILKLRSFDATAIRSVIVTFEHHINIDFSGYPQVRKYKELDLYSKIVCLADQFDAMTSSRVYSRIPMSPDKALSVMMERSGVDLDPLLFKFFINMVGVFPIGTLVMLDTKELGLVYESNAVFTDRPRVLIIIDSKENKVRGPVVNLAEKDETGRYMRSIIKVLDLNKYKINLAEYLL